MTAISQRRLTNLAFKECARVYVDKIKNIDIFLFYVDVVSVIFGTLMDEGTNVNYSDFYKFLYGSGHSLKAITSKSPQITAAIPQYPGTQSDADGP